ncbi:MAG: glycosyltransferase, partial [Salegentibacter mishustinae]|nr:glycosyltransferase [Salegentibacter mishustinae]
MVKGIVIVPTFNEIENIERLVRNVFSQQKEFHILVVDD